MNMPIKKATEKEIPQLYLRAKKGDQDALVSLHLYSAHILEYHMAKEGFDSDAIKDHSQSLFLHIRDAITRKNDENFDPKASIESLAHWKVKSALRQRSRFKSWFIRKNPDIYGTNDFADSTNSRLSHNQLVKAIDSLDEKHALPLRMVYINGYSYDEAQNLLGLKPGTLRTRIYDGKAKLIPILKKMIANRKRQKELFSPKNNRTS